MRLMMLAIGVAMVAVAAAIVFTFKIVWDDYVYNQQLVSVEVSAPAGWQVVPYETRHGEAIVVETLAPRDQPASTTQRYLRQFADLSADPHKGAAWTFAQGEELVALTMSFGPQARKAGGSVFDQLRAANATPAPVVDVSVATIAGQTLKVKPRLSDIPGEEFPQPVLYRRFAYQIGDPEVDKVLNLSVLTNSSDAAVAQAIASVDLTRANALLPTPDPDLDQSAGIVSAMDGGLLTVAPEPTVAYRALMLLQGGRDFGEPWTEAILKVQNGQITNWDEFAAAYPDSLDDAPYELLNLVTGGSEEVSARYFAGAMLGSGRQWNDHEHYILTKVSQLESAQSDFWEYMSGDYDVAPEVLALIMRLPEERTEPEADAPEVRSRPAVSNGFGQSSQCRMEGGVRRCTVGSSN
ncbi:hypothetical protein [Loktanella sp. S4079]|uniref:hypothetical protein n=1 Tax=Loktanella sp. S4079 TaxID=579483 RepID=UPI0005FA1AE2|nr:hypothetical protein [Loktanella sp. S4079]KJZ20794.1 hypothetical protein TW80_08590 [Loktanella sp. S4079]